MKVTIIGLGVGQGDITADALLALQSAKRIILRTGEHETAQGLARRGIVFDTLDHLYESEDFDALYQSIARSVIDSGENTVFAVPGSGSINDQSVSVLTALCEESGIEYVILPGLCWTQHEAAKVGGIGDVTIVSAMDVPDMIPDPRRALSVTELDSPLVAGDVKLRLSEHYPDDHVVLFCGKEIPLYELDRQSGYGVNTVLLVPPLGLMELQRRDCGHLAQVMEILRDPVSGCPWDREQTHESLGKYLVEEAYEVLDVIGQDDPMRLADELGDVLLQVAFHAQVAKEHGDFNLMDVTSAICQKMISRHTHIFGDAHAENSQQVLDNWEEIKKEEKGLSSPADVLRDVPKSFPALLRAAKVLSKAEKAGYACKFDLAELAGSAKDEESVGRMLMAAVNIARKLDVVAEIALQNSVETLIEDFASSLPDLE